MTSHDDIENGDMLHRDVLDIQLNRISGRDLGIWFNRISSIRYIPNATLTKQNGVWNKMDSSNLYSKSSESIYQFLKCK